MNTKTLGIIAGLVAIGYWLYNKFIISEKITLKPYSITIDPSFLQTRVKIQILVRNNSDNSVRIDRIAGKIINEDYETLATFQSNYSTEIKRNNSTILTIYGEAKSIDLFQLPNFKNFISKGIISVGGFYVPFNFPIKDYFQ